MIRAIIIASRIACSHRVPRTRATRRNAPDPDVQFITHVLEVGSRARYSCSPGPTAPAACLPRGTVISWGAMRPLRTPSTRSPLLPEQFVVLILYSNVPRGTAPGTDFLGQLDHLVNGLLAVKSHHVLFTCCSSASRVSGVRVAAGSPPSWDHDSCSCGGATIAYRQSQRWRRENRRAGKRGYDFETVRGVGHRLRCVDHKQEFAIVKRGQLPTLWGGRGLAARRISAGDVSQPSHPSSLPTGASSGYRSTANDTDARGALCLLGTSSALDGLAGDRSSRYPRRAAAGESARCGWCRIIGDIEAFGRRSGRRIDAASTAMPVSPAE